MVTIDAYSNYGKQFVPVFKVVKTPQRHTIFDMDVRTRLRGDLDKSFSHADNSIVLPTETQKNTCYAIALKHDFNTIEEYGIILGKHFLKNLAHIDEATVYVNLNEWHRLEIDGKPHHHVFTGPSVHSKRTCEVCVSRATGITVTSGVRDLKLLKTCQSGFAGYIVDQYTDLQAVDPTLKKEDRTDRILCTNAVIHWTFAPVALGDLTDTTGKGAPADGLNDAIVKQVLETFAGPADTGVYSRSVQETMYLIGRDVIAKHPTCNHMFFSLPNIHHYVYDTAKFGVPNPNVVYRKAGIPDNASGIIELAVSRAGVAGGALPRPTPGRSCLQCKL